MIGGQKISIPPRTSTPVSEAPSSSSSYSETYLTWQKFLEFPPMAPPCRELQDLAIDEEESIEIEIACPKSTTSWPPKWEGLNCLNISTPVSSDPSTAWQEYIEPLHKAWQSVEIDCHNANAHEESIEIVIARPRSTTSWPLMWNDEKAPLYESQPYSGNGCKMSNRSKKDSLDSSEERCSVMSNCFETIAEWSPRDPDFQHPQWNDLPFPQPGLSPICLPESDESCFSEWSSVSEFGSSREISACNCCLLSFDHDWFVDPLECQNSNLNYISHGQHESLQGEDASRRLISLANSDHGTNRSSSTRFQSASETSEDHLPSSSTVWNSQRMAFRGLLPYSPTPPYSEMILQSPGMSQVHESHNLPAPADFGGLDTFPEQASCDWFAHLHQASSLY